MHQNNTLTSMVTMHLFICKAAGENQYDVRFRVRFVIVTKHADVTIIHNDTAHYLKS